MLQKAVLQRELQLLEVEDYIYSIQISHDYFGITGVTSGANIMGIYVDGRLLIDGPADNSQVWSR